MANEKKRRPRGTVACTVQRVFRGGAGGADAKISPIKDEADFERLVLRPSPGAGLRPAGPAARPVMVVFYKGGCPTCLVLYPVLKCLAEEYGDRVLFYNFEIMKAYFKITAKAVKKQYHISFFPTVVLFVGGEERKRWVLKYRAASYRRTLDKVLAAGEEN
jgi:thiol-disulfide isomerase/thioredoxin